MRPVSEWEESDLDELHRGEIMENLTLEYKDFRVLENKVYQQGELFKDVSAFANSAGGILIFGMKESGHLPIGTDRRRRSVKDQEGVVGEYSYVEHPA